VTEEDILRGEEEKHRQAVNSMPQLLQIPTAHPFHSQVNVISNFSVKDPVKYKIFKDLWKKGLFIANGESFGGDFLTYHSDPTLYHASQIVHVIDRDKMFNHDFILSGSRLSLAVKKICVYAYLDENGAVVYQTLKWINPNKTKIHDDVAASPEVDETIQ
jgi:tRNA-splicing endonuclease subunit Sen34